MREPSLQLRGISRKGEKKQKKPTLEESAFISSDRSVKGGLL
jgi:hypothetical protein